MQENHGEVSAEGRLESLWRAARLVGELGWAFGEFPLWRSRWINRIRERSWLVCYRVSGRQHHGELRKVTTLDELPEDLGVNLGQHSTAHGPRKGGARASAEPVVGLNWGPTG